MPEVPGFTPVQAPPNTETPGLLTDEEIHEIVRFGRNFPVKPIASAEARIEGIQAEIQKRTNRGLNVHLIDLGKYDIGVIGSSTVAAQHNPQYVDPGDSLVVRLKRDHEITGTFDLVPPTGVREDKNDAITARSLIAMGEPQ